MSKQQRKGLAPALRFPEFRGAGEWSDIGFYDLLIDVLDFRGRTPKKLGMDWGGGNIISLSANNVKNGYIDLEAEGNQGSEALYQKWMGDVNLEKGDIVFTMEAPLGKALIVPDSRKYILSQRVVAFKTKKHVSNTFLIQLIWSDRFQQKINLLSTGSTAKGINQKTLKKVSVAIPENEKEQQKIADCLSSIDELVTAQSQKLEALKAHKKGLMQQLFPAEGETAPKLRFAEFREQEEWAETPLSNIVQLISGLHLSPSAHGASGSTPYFTGPSDFTNKELNISKWTSKSAALAIEHDILITVKGSGVGQLWYLLLPSVAIGRQLMAIRSGSCVSSFLYQFLSTKKSLLPTSNHPSYWSQRFIHHIRSLREIWGRLFQAN